ncbi:WD40/YVTN/BNR-like repeat-containing protein [Massilia putida]|uniref:WD40/YVTN/BNR-like repeat-containing protein n=1 Tax=Massilia putida TaxID=1141883 RepID=UPI0012EC9D13|nr:YCF48-related protein [Massilia putida]
MNNLNTLNARPGRLAGVVRHMAAAVLAIATLAAAAAGSPDPIDAAAAQSAVALKRPLSGIAAQGSTVVAVGAHGTILRSEDAGATWKQAAVPVAADLTTVRFTGPGIAWALGHDGVALRSADRGATWSRVLDGRALLALLNNHYRDLAARGDAGAVAVLDEVKRAAAQSATPDVLSYPFLDISIDAGGEGFLAGAFGLLLHTGDGGKSWEPWLERADNDRRMHLYALERASDGVFYLAGEQGLLRRYDRAAGRFTKLESPYAGTFFGLKAGEAGLAAFGLRGSAFVSADGGNSWKQLALGTEATVVDAVACAPGEMAFVTQDGRVLLGHGARATDAGAARGGEVAGAAQTGSGLLVLAGSAGTRQVRIQGCGTDNARIGKN